MKIKSAIKNGKNVVNLKLDAEYAVNAREFDLLSTKGVRGLMKVVSFKRRQFEYNGPLGIPVAERLAMPVSSREFFFFAAQVAELVKQVQKNGFAMCNLILDPGFVYVNGATKQLQFLYVPIVANTFYVDVRQFIGAMLALTHFDTRDDSVTVAQFDNFLGELPYFDPEKVLAYIAKADPAVMDQLKRASYGNSGFLTDDRREQYQHYNQRTPQQNGYEMQNGQARRNEVSHQTLYTPQHGSTGEADRRGQGGSGNNQTNGNDYYDATGLLKEDYAQTGLLNEEFGTSLLDSTEFTGQGGGQTDEYETTFLNESDTYSRNGRRPAVSYPKLKRASTGETVEINKPVFRIGKERSYVDYFIADNSAISRSHADIVCRNGRYYIVDRNSKNRTFVNEEPIPAGVEIEINSSTRLRLANEDFSFIAG